MTGKTHFWIVGLVLLAGAIGTVAWFRSGRPQPSATEATPASIAPIRPSRFLNTKPDAQYVGSQACRECHQDEHATYLATPHSRASQPAQPKDEPPDADFTHAASSRVYRVYREGDRVRHEESIQTSNDDPISIADFDLHTRIGSGGHARTYLIERDGFLLESPLTWYESNREWRMSPGYDQPAQPGFQRNVNLECMSCHAGRVTAEDEGHRRLAIHEATIGCESCHGPGSLHVAARKAGQDPGEEDLTIVHPAHLTRERREMICAQCHLRGQAMTPVRGRSRSDFRPGLHLHDFRIDFSSAKEDAMSVVGHIEQMRLSECYRQSEMTCTSCHDPHARPDPQQRVEYFRQKCLACHELDDCAKPHDERIRLQPQDDCAACHMPRGDTDIPHVAFTHHRIGIHAKPSETETDALVGDSESVADASPRELVPLADVSHLPELDQERNLGLAYLEFAENQESDSLHKTYRSRGLKLLAGVYQEGLRDVRVASILAGEHYRRRNLTLAVEFAQRGLEHPGPEAGRSDALYLLASAKMDMRQPEEALAPLEALIQRRLECEDWVLLAIVRRALGKEDEALAALEYASSLNPSRPDVYEMLVSLYESRGDTKQLVECRRRLRALAPDESP